MLDRPIVVATGTVTDATHRMLQPHAAVVVAPDDTDATLIGLVPEAIGLIVRGGSSCSSDVITAGGDLRVIARSGIGVDGVDVAAATARGIPVVVVPGAGSNAVAEGAFAMMLALTKRLTALDGMVRAGRWRDRDTVELGDLEGAVLGVVGFGRIGRRVAQLGAAFGMEVIAFDPYVPDADIVAAGAGHATLEDLVRRSDYVSLHAPLTEETRGMITRASLDGARPGLILVNLGRGGLIGSLDDLHQGLEEGILGGVGLDVVEPEPPDHTHPLFRHERALFAPHLMGLTRRSRERIFEEMARGMVDALEGRRPADVANPEIYDARP